MNIIISIIPRSGPVIDVTAEITGCCCSINAQKEKRNRNRKTYRVNIELRRYVYE